MRRAFQYVTHYGSANQQTVEMAAVDVDVVESALRDLNLSSGREIVLKQEQESAVRALLADRDVLAVLRTGYGKIRV